jgi:hypothetical protein
MTSKLILAGVILGIGAMVQAGWFSFFSEPASVALFFAALAVLGLALKRRLPATTNVPSEAVAQDA